jgi:pimeloyl-ACP methyl ester carboxylesterase
MRRKLAIGFLGMVILLVVGFTYNAIMCARLAHLHPVPGSFQTVNGRLMHLYCIGSGAPTVILESGLGDDWIIWQRVQPELSRTVRVCSYDRAGVGWSEAQSGPRNALSIARQLHLLLTSAQITGPLVMVGHSAGGLYIRVFSVLYPSNVVGMVFVDAASPEVFHLIPGSTETVAQRRTRHQKATWAALKRAVGWTRLTGGCHGTVPPGLEAYVAFDAAEECRPASVLSSMGEQDDFEDSAKEVANLPCCAGLPILVISQDPGRPKSGWDAQSLAANPIWASLQERLKTLSPHNHRIIARGSGHHVMLDRPDAVIAGIREFLATEIDNSSSPDNGTTVTR